jgi:hypothetical protein
MGVPSGSLAVCVAGMHRAGTSMVARLLNRCGMYLGPRRDIVRPAPDNPEGFWENVNFVVIDDMVLEVLGGTWDAPPTFPPGWEECSPLGPLRLAALELLARFRGRRFWGWKDPRSTLTLPFWRRLQPGLAVVVCVRNPLEVAASLERRDGLPLAEGLSLWHTYYSRLLTDVPASARVVTRYADYLADGPGELARVLARLGLERSGRTIRTACAEIGPRLRHHRASLEELARAGADPALLGTYLALEREAAGPEASLPDLHAST